MSCSFTIHSHLAGLITVSVNPPTEQHDSGFLCLKVDEQEFNLFRNGPTAIEDFLELGYQIVNQCRTLQAANEPLRLLGQATDPFVPEDIDFGESLEAGIIPVKLEENRHDIGFAINDAISHAKAAELLNTPEYRDLAERL